MKVALTPIQDGYAVIKLEDVVEVKEDESWVIVIGKGYFNKFLNGTILRIEATEIGEG